MIEVEVQQKTVLASGITNLIVQGENGAEEVRFVFNSPNPILTNQLRDCK